MSRWIALTLLGCLGALCCSCDDTDTTGPVEPVDTTATISNIRLPLDSGDVLLLNEFYEATFDYRTTGVDSVLLFARPRGTGVFLFQASPVMPPQGTDVKRFFSVRNDARPVTGVELSIKDRTNTATLFDTIIPHRYTVVRHFLTVSNITPLPPDTVNIGHTVSVSIDYGTSSMDSIALSAWPLNGSDSLSGVQSDWLSVPDIRGSVELSFTVNTPSECDSIGLYLWNATDSLLLFQKKQPAGLVFE